MLAISLAPELDQHIIQQVLHDCEGARHNIADDIIVHSRNAEEQGNRLIQVFQRLKDKSLPVNSVNARASFEFRESPSWSMSSERGFGPVDEKFKAVYDVREPSNVAGARSFLGLVNFCARFIPDLATTAEPLKSQTHQGMVF